MDKDSQDKPGPQSVDQKSSQNKPVGRENMEMFLTIRRITAWVMVMSAILFALIGVLAIWDVLGDGAGNVVWRAFSSLAVIAFASLIVNVASRGMMSKH